MYEIKFTSELDNRRRELEDLMIKYGYMEENLADPFYREQIEDHIKNYEILEHYDYQKIEDYCLEFWGFCPPRPLLEKMCGNYFDPLCPFWETGEREMLLDEIALYLGFKDGYPINSNKTSDFEKEFSEKLTETIKAEKWLIASTKSEGEK